MTDADLPGGSLVVGGLPFNLLIGPEEIHEGITRIALQLGAEYAVREPVVVCVLNGAAIFHSDLVRQLRFPLVLDYLRVSSYSGEMQSTGRVTFSAPPGTQTAGRNVIIVEDIVDTGRTSLRLREYFHEQGALTVAIVTLLYKPDAHHMGPPPEYVVFEIPDRFVVGYGLDYQQEGRNLPGIFVLDQKAD